MNTSLALLKLSAELLRTRGWARWVEDAGADSSAERAREERLADAIAYLKERSSRGLH